MISERKWPVVMASQLILGNPDSNVAICTLWTPRQKVAAMLDPSRYAVIGNLYSRDGLNYLVENLLANPRISFLVVTGVSQSDMAASNVPSDSRNALLALFSRDMNIPALDSRFDQADLARLFASLKLLTVPLASLHYSALLSVSQVITHGPGRGEPVYYPPREVLVADVLPSEGMGYTVHRETISEAWLSLLDLIMRYGRVTGTSFGSRQRELLALTTVIDRPNVEEAFPAWSPADRDSIDAYLKAFWRRDEVPGVTYQYGHRLLSKFGEDQVALMVSKLGHSHASRSAYCSLWEPVADSHNEDPPCLTSLHGLIRDGKLHLFATIRSNDMYRAWPFNAVSMASVQSSTASSLRCDVGQLGILSTSAHIYEENWGEAKEKGLLEAAKYRNTFSQDRRGSVVFRWDGIGEADVYSPEGDKLLTVRGQTVGVLRRALEPYVGLVGHGLYLGGELVRLFQMREEYEQDAV